MADNLSDYPSALDPAPVELVDGHDYVPADALTYWINQIDAIQDTLGLGLGDLTGFGGPNFGSIQGLLQVLYRMASGTASVTTSSNEHFVAFPQEFERVPLVRVQFCNNSGAVEADFIPKRIQTDGFYLGWQNKASLPGTASVFWVAFDIPYGSEQSV